MEPPLGNLKLAAKKTRLPNDYGLNVSNAGNAKSRSLSFLLRYCKRPILSNETHGTVVLIGKFTSAVL